MAKISKLFLLAQIVSITIDFPAKAINPTFFAQNYLQPVIALRAVGTTVSEHTTGTSIVLNAPAGVMVGDVEIAQVFTNNGASETITPPTGWTLIRNDELYDSSNWKNLFYTDQYFYYKVAGSSEPSTYTFTTSVTHSYRGGVIVAYSGVNNSTPVDVSNCTTAVTSNSGTDDSLITAPSITTTRANDQILFTAIQDIFQFPATPVANNFSQELTYNDGAEADYIYDVLEASIGATPSFTFWTGGYETYAACQMALAPAASSTISLRGTSSFVENENTNGCGSGSCNLTLNKPSGVVAGDVMIAQIFYGGSPFAYSLAGWTQIRQDTFSSGNYGQYLFYKVAGSSEPSTYTFTESDTGQYGAGLGGTIIAYTGVNTVSPVDVSSCTVNTPDTSGANVSVPSITTAQANDRLLLIFAGLNQSSYDIIAVVANFSQQWFNNDSTNAMGNYGADRIQTAAGATGTRSIPTGSGMDTIACQIALIP